MSINVAFVGNGNASIHILFEGNENVPLDKLTDEKLQSLMDAQVRHYRADLEAFQNSPPLILVVTQSEEIWNSAVLNKLIVNSRAYRCSVFLVCHNIGLMKPHIRGNMDIIWPRALGRILR
jgi:hypothetical protein